MKIVFLLFPLIAFGQLKVEPKKLQIKLEYEIIERKILLKDTIYICKNVNVRVSKDTIFIYGKRQYLKIKR